MEREGVGGGRGEVEWGHRIEVSKKEGNYLLLRSHVSASDLEDGKSET